jgi:integration host factor subunit alpha
MSLTKVDIVETTYEHLDIPKKDCIRIVDSLFEIIKGELGKGNNVMISGFGKWSVRVKKKRIGRNPQTGKKIIIDARSVVTFKPSAVLRDAVASIEPHFSGHRERQGFQDQL